MNTWADETLALSVSEATMQDWLAAAATIREAPPTFFDTRPAHPPVARPAIARRAPAADRAGATPPKATAAQAAGVGGARTAYWLALAAAVAVLAYV